MLNNPYSGDATKQRMIYLYLIEEKTLHQIGQEMGCSRQWVHLVLKAANVPIRCPGEKCKSQVKPKTEAQMRKEVEKELGFRRCHKCKLLKRIEEDFTPSKRYTCIDCNRLYVAEYNRSERGKAKVREWQDANRDKHAAACKRYYQKRKAQQEVETP